MDASPQSRGLDDLLTLGFGASVSMWGIAYVARLLELRVDSRGVVLMLLCLTVLLLLGCHIAAGMAVGRYTSRGPVGGAQAGLITGVINLLAVACVLGGDQPNQLRASALPWIAGTIIVAVCLTTLGARVVERNRRPAPGPEWHGGLAIVAACATFMLLMIGGLVTGLDEGLAVVDWPNTETYNMFLYPLARMIGGIFLEHAHRLFATLVGLTTLALTMQVLVADRRRAVKGIAITALICVVVQGILGGLRVTGRFTFSDNPADTQPRIVLAIVHGVFGQIVFGSLVALAVLRSGAWRRSTSKYPAPGAPVDRTLSVILLLMLVTQLVMGALVRHFTWALYKLRFELATDPPPLIAAGHWALTIHVTLAVLVTLATVAAGVRAWGLYEPLSPLRRCGIWLLALIGGQLLLGILALIVTGNDAPDNPPGLPDALVTTAHQALGAALLALTVLLLLWNSRLLTSRDAAQAVTAASSAPVLSRSQARLPRPGR